jgi:hypothetical protein
VVQEAARRRLDVDFLALAAHLQPVERLHRAVRLALRRAEGGEVVPADEHRRTLLHRFHVEGHRDMPHPPAIQCRRRPSVEDAVEIAPPDAREARVPVIRDLLDVEYRHRLRPHQRVEALAQPVRRERLRDIDVHRHGERMHPRIGAPSRRESGALPRHALQRFLERLLDRRPVILPLPPHEGPAVIFDRQPPAGHGRIAPFGIEKPRSSSPAVITDRPARWTFSARI